MTNINFLLLPLCFYSFGYSQIPVKRIDSLVKVIDSKTSLTVDTVCGTSEFAPEMSAFECLKFYSMKGRLFKAVYLINYYRKDTLLKNSSTHYDVYYYNNGLLIKAVSRDFDQSPPKDLQLYFDEKDMKKYLSLPKEIKSFSRFDGRIYFIEQGYSLLEEFKLLDKR